MNCRGFFPALICASFVLAPLAYAQDAPDDESTQGVRRPSVGFRVNYFADPEFKAGSASAVTTNPAANYAYTATTDSTKFVPEPFVEYRLKKRLSIGVEFRLHTVEFQQVDQIRTGVLPPGVTSGSTNDTRPVTTITATTQARYWEFPLLARYYGLQKSSGLLRHMYLAGGLEYRHVGDIRTGTDYVYADGTTNYNEVPATPNRTNQIGAVVGIGVRFIDDFNIKVAPEIRFTRWVGTTFQGPGYVSEANQLEAGLGISF
jgi:hypothetical protein